MVVRVDQGNLTAAQMHGLARLAADAADGLLRIGIDQNILLGFIPLGRLRGLHAALRRARPGRRRARARLATSPLAPELTPAIWR